MSSAHAAIVASPSPITALDNGTCVWFTDFAGSEDVESLRRLGITRIFNLSGESKPLHIQDQYKEHGITEHRFRINDVESGDIVGVVKDMIDSCAGLTEHVLVHCQACISRSPAAAVGLAMYRLLLPFERVFAMAKRARPSIDPNAGFVRKLTGWGRQFEFAKTPSQ